MSLNVTQDVPQGVTQDVPQMSPKMSPNNTFYTDMTTYNSFNSIASALRT